MTERGETVTTLIVDFGGGREAEVYLDAFCTMLGEDLTKVTEKLTSRDSIFETWCG